MPRIRTIKPEFWQDEDLATISAEARLLAIGLLNHADDEGYFNANPMIIRAAVFPFHEESSTVPVLLQELSKIGYIELLEGVDGKNYGLILSFLRHQVISKPKPSKIKGLCESRTSAGQGLDESMQERKGKEGKGKEQGESARTEMPPSAQNFKSKLPPGLVLTDHQKKSANDYWISKGRDDLTLKTQDIFDQFTTHAEATGKVYLDWGAGWRKWYMNEVNFQRQANANSNGNYQSATDRAEAAFQSKLAEFSAQ